ncbi:MAG TPA: AraC family transcriptional regulator ligand-binding domain-containing protein, partial [Nevskiaceae bacterium]|nr:AraC family transcriptional regulator ligand-binding domain-containing protein [Nevskiaceae bacterium]
MAGNFVRSALLSGAEELIRQLGGRPPAVARRAGVPFEALRDPDIPLPGRAAYDFLETAADETRCRTFGLRLGAEAHMASVIGPLYVLLRNAQTIGQMFEDLAANFDIYTGIATVTIEPADGGLLLAWSSTAGYADSEVQMAEYALAVMCQEIRRQTGTDWTSQSVEFRHAAPRNLADHHRVFGRHLGFNRDRNTVFLDRAIASHASGSGATRSRRLVTSLLRREEGVIDPTIAARVESIVRSLMPFAPCNVADVARALGMPVRTLQHQL